MCVKKIEVEYLAKVLKIDGPEFERGLSDKVESERIHGDQMERTKSGQ